MNMSHQGDRQGLVQLKTKINTIFVFCLDLVAKQDITVTRSQGSNLQFC